MTINMDKERSSSRTAKVKWKILELEVGLIKNQWLIFVKLFVWVCLDLFQTVEHILSY